MRDFLPIRAKPDPTCPCRLCGQPTRMLGTELCDGCWELERRVTSNPELTRKILANLDRENLG